MLNHFGHSRLLETPWTVAARVFCPWDSPGKNTGVGCQALLQGIFLTQGSNPYILCLLHWQACSLPTEPHQGFPGGWDGKESAYSAGHLSSIPESGRSPGEGNGNPLQHSCLENPMDRGAWRAVVHGVTKSWKRLSNEHFHFQRHSGSPISLLLHGISFLWHYSSWKSKKNHLARCLALVLFKLLRFTLLRAAIHWWGHCFQNIRYVDKEIQAQPESREAFYLVGMLKNPPRRQRLSNWETSQLLSNHLGGGSISWIPVWEALVHVWRPESTAGCDVPCLLMCTGYFRFTHT